jgi:Tyrosyl-DNA phosphodiesterase
MLLTGCCGRFFVSAGTHLVVGRELVDRNDTRISRQHLCLRVELDGGATVELIGRNAISNLRHNSGVDDGENDENNWLLLQPDVKHPLRALDTVYVAGNRFPISVEALNLSQMSSARADSNRAAGTLRFYSSAAMLANRHCVASEEQRLLERAPSVLAKAGGSSSSSSSSCSSEPAYARDLSTAASLRAYREDAEEQLRVKRQRRIEAERDVYARHSTIVMDDIAIGELMAFKRETKYVDDDDCDDVVITKSRKRGRDDVATPAAASARLTGKDLDFLKEMFAGVAVDKLQHEYASRGGDVSATALGISERLEHLEARAKQGVALAEQNNSRSPPPPLLLRDARRSRFAGPQRRFYLTSLVPLYGGTAALNVNALRLGADVVVPGLQYAAVAAMLLDPEWLLSEAPAFLDSPRVEVAVQRSQAERVAPFLPAPTFRLCTDYVQLATMSACNHGKMMLLFYGHFMRIVVSTGNFIPLDFKAKSNGMWVRDCPRTDNRAAQQPPSAQDFERTLVDYVRALGMSAELVARIKQHDFSTVRAILVSSVPGLHRRPTDTSGSRPPPAVHYGHMKVRAALEQYGVPPRFRDGAASLSIQMSSIGQLDTKWLMSELAQSFGLPSDSAANIEHRRVEIVWPSFEFLRRCNVGYLAGNELFLNKSAYERKTVPYLRDIMHRYVGAPARQRVSPHIKTFALHRGNELAYFLLTSANLSKPALGNLCLGNAKLRLNNFELGVLIHPALFGDAPMHAGTADFPLPYELPPHPYNHQTEPPFVRGYSATEPDRLGLCWPLRLPGGL